MHYLGQTNLATWALRSVHVACHRHLHGWPRRWECHLGGTETESGGWVAPAGTVCRGTESGIRSCRSAARHREWPGNRKWWRHKMCGGKEIKIPVGFVIIRPKLIYWKTIVIWSPRCSEAVELLKSYSLIQSVAYFTLDKYCNIEKC